MKQFSEQLPLLTLVAVILGYFDLYIYYALYGVDISSYLTVSEILFSFSTILIVILGCGFLGFVYFGQHFQQPTFSFQETIVSLPKKRHYVWRASLFIIGALIIITLTDMLPLQNFPAPITIAIFFILLFGPASYLFQPILKNLNTVKPIQKTLLFACAIFVFCMFLLVINVIKHHYLNSGIPKYNLQLIMVDKTTMETNDNLVYIGSTSAYHLLLNRENEQVQILSKTDVSAVKIQKLRQGL